MAQTAYELERFANRPLDTKPRMRAVRGNKQKLKVNTRQVRMIASAVVLVVMAMGLVQSQATVAQLTTEIQAVNKRLVNAQSQNNYLVGVMDSKTSLKNVEQIAITQLGLMKMDKSQITYVTLEQQAAVERPQSDMDRWIDALVETWHGLFDQLGSQS